MVELNKLQTNGRHHFAMLDKDGTLVWLEFTFMKTKELILSEDSDMAQIILRLIAIHRQKSATHISEIAKCKTLLRNLPLMNVFVENNYPLAYWETMANGYATWPAIRKIEYIFRCEKRALTSDELTQRIDHLCHTDKKHGFRKYLSKYLNLLCRRKVIRRCLGTHQKKDELFEWCKPCVD